MLPEQQQRIMGYFIEEAKDHLNTIEQGLLNLQATIEDPEMANEVFRAAHSVKGGAAMLGLESIQRTSHRMEDYFKILKEARIQADRTLESMFLQVFDALQEQLEQLQGPFGLTDDKAEEIMAGVEPVFDQLEGHLNQLVATAGGDQPQPTPSPAPAVSRRNSEDSALQLVFNSDVSSYLRDMLGLFKQADTGQSRQSLQDICQQLTGFGEQFELSDWVNLTRTAKLAIAHPENSYGTLAPIIIREIKQAKDLVLAGRISEVQVSNSLQSLIPVEVAPADLELEALALDDVGTGEELSGEDDLFGDGADLAPDNLAPDELLLDTLDLDGDANTSADEGFDDLFTDTAGADLDSLAAADSPADTLPDLGLDALEALPELASNADTGNLEGGLDGLMGIGADPTGPEVGAAELNSLADLFEGDLGDLDDTWQEEDAALETPTGDVPDIDISSDFADLLETADSDNSDTLDSGDELADLFGDVLEESDLPDVPSTDMPPPNAPEDISADIGLDLADGLSELGLDSELDSGADDSLDLDLLGAFDEESSPAPVSSPEPFPEPFSAELAPEPDVLDLNDGLLDLDLADIPDVSPGEDDDALDSDLGAVFDVSDGLGGDDTAPLADLDLGDALALDDVSQSVADVPALDLEPDEGLDLGLEDSALADDLNLDLDLGLGETDTADAVLDDLSSTLEATAPLDLTSDVSDLDISASDDGTSDDGTESLGGLFGDVENDAALAADLALSLDEPPAESLSVVSEVDETDASWLSEANLGESPLPDSEASDELGLDELGLDELNLDTPDLDISGLADPTATDQPDLGDSALELNSALELDSTADISPSQAVSESNNDDLSPGELDLNELGLDELASDSPETGGLETGGLEIADAVSDADAGPDSRMDTFFADGPETDEIAAPATTTSIDSFFDVGHSLPDEQPVDSDFWSDPEPAAPKPAADLDNISVDLQAAHAPELADIALETESDTSTELGNDLESDLWNSDLSDIHEAASPAVEDGIELAALELTDDLWEDPNDSPAPVTDLPPESETSNGDSDELANLDLELADSSDELADLDLELEGSSDELADLDLELEGSSDELADLDLELEGSSDELADLDLELADSSDELAGLDLDLEGSPELAAAAETPLEDLTDSSLGNGDSLDDLFTAADTDSLTEQTDADNLALGDDLNNLLEDETGGDVDLPNELDDLLSDATPAAADLDLAFTTDNLAQANDLGLSGLSDTAANDLDDLLADPPSTLDSTDDLSADDLSADDLSVVESADFADLDALLDEPTPTADEPTQDDFADLDALLANDSTSPSLVANDSPPRPTQPPSIPAPDMDGDEFDDLEKLLEEADQALGGPTGASTSRRAAPSANRLATRRPSGVLGEQTMRVSVKHLDNLSNLVGELVVNRNTLEQDQERLRQFLDNLLFQVQQLNDVGQRMRDLYERSLLESSLISSRQSYQMAGTAVEAGGASSPSHATGETFDALEMDRFTGFHTLSQEMIELIVRVRESASDIAYTVESADQVTRQFRQVTTQLQEGLNKARMVPFAQTADRLPRAVRDISLKCGKEARLVVEGRDTLIDKMILEQLYDPMTHLVNNAITHGIESPDEREAAGKPREGSITVRAFYQGNQTVIYVADDGGGINPDLVKRKAVQRGLISQGEARTMSVLDVYELLFHPGFSTRDQADDFAGRGVGMDVVRTSLAEIRGSITIDSEMGKGTSFTIRLPLTLSISKALSCISNQARIAFPMDGVEDMFDVPRERIQQNEQGEQCILWRDTLLPFQQLSDLLKFNRTLGRGRVYGGHQDDDVISIVVLRSANTYIALEVDQVIGEQEIVIKQLEGPVPKPVGIAGATVLGDGRVMPIADVLELIDLAMGRVRREPTTATWTQVEEVPPEEQAAGKSEPTVLIVDDSITVRELLSMSFNKVGYRVEQARDGQEAWEKMRAGLPCDLVFCDIEMPRMDGLELLSRMQKDNTLRRVPIAMLTSRGADRHRQMAVDLGASGYFTKPYLEEALLDAAQKMLNGESMIK